MNDELNNNGKLKTGWKKLNEMLNGGIRRTELGVILALQHKYKSGFTKSIFMQIARHNKPNLIDKNKKPLLLFISLEDNMEDSLDFFYKYLYYNENRKMPDMTEVDKASIPKYIKEKLSINGFHIKILRVNPSDWTYKDIFNRVLMYEASGYEIVACFIDYLSKLPTTYTNNSGPQGTGYRDLFDRIRNFFVSKRIAVITPHQLSTEAKQLIRNGVPGINFVKEVVGKGYYSESKQIDQVVDLELYIHIAKYQRKPVLTVQRGKHRTTEILDEDKMYFMLPFPYKAPIPEDITDDDELGISGDELIDEEDFDF